MKTKFPSLFLFCISILVSFYSCDKDPIPLYSKDIVGQWQWIKTMRVIPQSATNPETPQNTGIEELLTFNSNNTWFKIQNKALVDSGTYSLGHGTFTNPSNTVFVYDSICYYQNKVKVESGFDFYEIHHDTLLFCSGFADRWWAYTLPFAGTKRWIRKK
jgi:hypothetical protein